MKGSDTEHLMESVTPQLAESQNFRAGIAQVIIWPKLLDFESAETRHEWHSPGLHAADAEGASGFLNHNNSCLGNDPEVAKSLFPITHFILNPTKTFPFYTVSPSPILQFALKWYRSLASCY